MTTTLTIATCPRCGNVATVFVRSDDGSDLVCRGDSPPSSIPTDEPVSPRQSVLREGVSHGSALVRSAPSRKSYRRIP